MLTSHRTQQHFLVEGGRPLAALAQAVPCGLIDGKASQGICHLEEREDEPLCSAGRLPPQPPRLGAACQLQPRCQAGGAAPRSRGSELASGDQRPSGHGGTHLPAQRGAEPVVESQEAVSADHTHRHPHHPHLHLLLCLQVDLGQSPAASVCQPSAGAGQKRESAGQQSGDGCSERLSGELISTCAGASTQTAIAPGSPHLSSTWKLAQAQGGGGRQGRGVPRHLPMVPPRHLPSSVASTARPKMKWQRLLLQERPWATLRRGGSRTT